VLGVVGIIEDVGKAVPSGFQREGDLIAVFSPYNAEWNEEADRYDYEQSFGSSAFAQVILQEKWGAPPGLFIEYDRRANDAMSELAEKGLLNSASDISDGGFAIAVAKACLAKSISAHIIEIPALKPIFGLFGEYPAFLLSFSQSSLAGIKQVLENRRLGGLDIVGRTGGSLVEIKSQGHTVVAAEVEELRSAYSGALESQIAAEVVTA
jgi:phosphoribosylformylglycinamidine synthase